MTTFTYIDNTQGHKILFACETDSISQADKLFTKSTGINPCKAPHIGCAPTKKVIYTFTCPACGKDSLQPGYCTTCTQEMNTHLDWVTSKDSTPDPLPEDFAILAKL